MLQAEIGMLKSGPLVTDEEMITRTVSMQLPTGIEIRAHLFDIVESFTMIARQNEFKYHGCTSSEDQG